MNTSDSHYSTYTYNFSVDWFTSQIPIWSEIIDQSPWIRRILEIGSFEGRSAVWLIDQIAAERPLEIHCVDTWEGSNEHQKIDMRAVEERFDHNINLAASAATFPP